MELRWNRMERTESGSIRIDLAVTNDEGASAPYTIVLELGEDGISFEPEGELELAMNSLSETEDPDTLEGAALDRYRTGVLVDEFLGRLAERGILESIDEDDLDWEGVEDEIEIEADEDEPGEDNGEEEWEYEEDEDDDDEWELVEDEEEEEKEKPS